MYYSYETTLIQIYNTYVDLSKTVHYENVA